MKNYSLKLRRAIVKLIRKRAHRISISEWLTLILTTVVLVAGTSFVAIKTIDYKVKSDKAEAYDNAIKSTTNTVDNVVTTTRVEDEDKKQALKDLKTVKEHSKSLGTIRILESTINVTHSVQTNNENSNKWAIIEKMAPAIYRSYLEATNIEWELDDTGKILIAYIDRPTIKKEDVTRNTRVKPTILKHPTASLTEKFSEKNELIQFWKTNVDNDYKKGYISDKDVADLDIKWDTTFDDAAYDKVVAEVLTDEDFIKEAEEISLNTIKNIYNPNISPKKVWGKDGKLKDLHLPLNRTVEPRFKDERN